jgi:UDP-N-acetylmuramoyl-tripeptide--D-alanyl-D-alanine ligase
VMGIMTLSAVSAALGSKLIGRDTGFSRVSIDTRTLKHGDLFVALKGENFDGNKFIPHAANKGACGAVVSSEVSASLASLKVNDTQIALGKLAEMNRSLYIGILVAITGSGGKTTTKNILSSIFSLNGKTSATRGNLNNEIGVPLTLLDIKEDDRYVIVEMGAAFPGDLNYLCNIAKPNVAVLLNAMPAHIQGFGSLEGVAAAKGEILSDLSATDVAVINRDSSFYKQWRKRAGSARIIDFGLDRSAQISASKLCFLAEGATQFDLRTPQGSRTVTLKLLGRHNVMNAMAATAAAIAAEIDIDVICKGLESVQAVCGRLCPLVGINDFLLIDDSYNANPEAVKAAIDVLAQYQGKRYLLLGDMGELGDDARLRHAEVGRYALEQGIDFLWGMGSLTAEAVNEFGSNARMFSEKSEIIRAAKLEISAEDTVLVKGSRFAAMDEIVEALNKNNDLGAC